MRPALISVGIVALVATASCRGGSDSRPARQSIVAGAPPSNESLSAALDRVFDTLFSVGVTREAVRQRLGPPRTTEIHAIRRPRDADQWPLMYLQVGDSLASWSFADLVIDFRIRQVDSSVAVHALPAFLATRGLLQPLASPPGADSALVPAALGFALIGDTSVYFREFGSGAALELRYVRDSLIAVHARRSMCPPGPEC